MKIIASVLTIVFILCGCSTLKPVELSQATVQERISTGDLINLGDNVRIITIDEKQYDFKVTSIVDDNIKGKDIEIPIDEVALVEKYKISIGKTALLGGGLFLLFIMSQF